MVEEVERVRGYWREKKIEVLREADQKAREEGREEGRVEHANGNGVGNGVNGVAGEKGTTVNGNGNGYFGEKTAASTAV